MPFRMIKIPAKLDGKPTCAYPDAVHGYVKRGHFSLCIVLDSLHRKTHSPPVLPSHVLQLIIGVKHFVATSALGCAGSWLWLWHSKLLAVLYVLPHLIQTKFFSFAVVPSKVSACSAVGSDMLMLVLDFPTGIASEHDRSRGAKLLPHKNNQQNVQVATPFPFPLHPIHTHNTQSPSSSNPTKTWSLDHSVDFQKTVRWLRKESENNAK